MGNYTIHAFPHYVLRTPLFSLTFYSDLMASYSYQNLFLKLENDYVREAIRLASPELLTALDRWKFDPYSLSEKKTNALELSFLKYLTRMSSRCTPFGLFAGCAVGEISSETNILLESPKKHSRHTQFDTQFWIALLQNFAKKEDIAPHLKYYPNNSIYKLGDFYRYVEYKYINTKREHTISALRRSELLELLLNKSKSGITINEMVSLLADDDSETEDAREYINQLIDFQFLTSELDGLLTAKEDWERVFKIIKRIPASNSILELLQKIKKKLLELDHNLIPSEKKYKEILDEIQKLEIEYESKYLFQTDLNVATTFNTINNTLSKKTLQGIHFLNGIQKKTQSENQLQFIKAFEKRYETREMPLTKVLDTETGIGYLQNQDMNDNHDLLEGLFTKNKVSDEAKQTWTTVDFILEKKLQETNLSCNTALYLSEKDFPDYDANWDNVPATFSVIVECFKKNSSEFIAIESSGNVSAAKLLGRFCNGNTLIEKLTAEIIEKENSYHLDKILAEIVHIPESRTGNILRRPVLRKYEIPYLSNSGVSEKYQIGLEDLMISVKNGTIVLRSKKYKKEIIPCLSNAHNYAYKSLPIYHFLSELQSQNLKPVYNFSWGVLMTHYNYFPRVVYKDIILSKAQWKVIKAELIPFYSQNSTSLFTEFTTWRKKRNIPEFINLVNFDNKLLIDLEKEIGIQLFLKSVSNQSSIILEEFLFTEESIVKNEKEEHFSNQIILSFYKQKAKL